MRIAYCGPIAQPGQPARGGFESANRRLIDDLRRRGIDVLEFAYPVALGTKAAKSLTYGRGFASIAGELVQQRRRFDILHITPLYRQFLYAEAVLCLIAWGLGKRVVFDIRAGRFVQRYRDRGSAYRKLVDTLMTRADVLALEGMRDLDFVELRHDKPILYLPNYVRAHTARHDVERNDETVRLVFLGRIVPEKGIETAIGALEALLAMGIPAHLEVIGDGDESYVHALKNRTADQPVSWTGPLAADAIRPKLAAAHFFVFPTWHAGEGHSNALTEAMAEGAVPICSENGFNRSVVSEAGKVLSLDASAADYAETIATVWRSGTWPALSAAAETRVANNFTSDVVVSGLIQRYLACAAPSLPQR